MEGNLVSAGMCVYVCVSLYVVVRGTDRKGQTHNLDNYYL